MGDDLQNLDEKLARFREQESALHVPIPGKDKANESMNQGLRAGTELVACIIAGTFIGWALDRWLDMAPLFLIIFFLGGIGAGFTNAYRITQNMDSAVGYKQLHNQKKQARKEPGKDG